MLKYNLQDSEHTTVSNFIAFCAIMAMFPLFLIYQLLGAAGIIPLFLGGGFGITAAAFSILLATPFLLMFLHRRPRRQAYFILCFIILWLTVGLIIGINASPPASASANVGQYKIAVKNHIFNFVYWYVLFTAGLFWGKMDRGKKFFLFVTFLAISVVILLYANALRLLFYRDAEEATSTYQHIARSVSVLGLISVAYIRNKYIAILSYIILVVQLFFVEARAEFAAIALLAPFIFFLYCQDTRYRVFYILTGSAVIFLIIFLFSHSLSDLLTGSRQAGLLNLSEDRSWLERQKALESGLRAIVENPFFGEFAGEVIRAGQGGYIHNILSVWRQYGLIPFLLFVGIQFYGLLDSIDAVFFRKEHDSLAKITLFINVTSLLLLIAAKSVFWPVMAFGWGLSAQLAARPIDNRSFFRTPATARPGYSA